MQDPLYNENIYMNRNFTIQEVKNAVFKSKNGKSPGIDHIPYEVLKYDVTTNVLTHLYQLCFDSGRIPSIWQRSIINPIEKSKDNDPRIPLNYRGISLICCTAKIYSSLLNGRVSEFLEDNQLTCDEQNGFRKDRSCTDHIFTLNSVLQNCINKENRSVYAAFIDFKKAFDCIDRNYLLFKVLNEGIEGKLYWAIKSIYSKNEACVRLNTIHTTDWFSCDNGVRQGDILSPTLFSIFINDLSKEINMLDKGVEFGQDKLSILLYADDVVLLSHSADGLQSMLDSLDQWSKKWKVYVNRTKSKIIHFRKKEY
jgi:hypothetical protein